MKPRGLGSDDLPAIYREEYLHAVETTRASINPCEDWDAFVDALWLALVPAFGLDVRVDQHDPHPTSVPASPRESQ